MSRCRDCERRDRRIRELEISIRCGAARELKLVNERERLLSQIAKLKKRSTK